MFENILGWSYGVVALAIGLATAFLLKELLPIKSSIGRNTAIDGLRGYLSFGVFMHHSVIWYFYIQTNQWEVPPTSVYTNLGAICVSLFFMITGYLFFGKILCSRERPIDWIYLYTSRIFRLTPLYLFVIIALSLLVGMLSGWTLHQPIMLFAKGIANWIAFSIIRAPDLNGISRTSLMTAGVTWTLAYEWLFYLSLPALALLLRSKVSVLLAISCSSLIVFFVIYRVDPVFFPTSFIKGGIAAYIVRLPKVVFFLRKPACSLVTIFICLGSIGGLFSTTAASMFLAIAFFIIASGNTLFGILSNRAAIYLGDVSYGIYLIHGLLLFITFVFVIGAPTAKLFSPMLYWFTIYGAAIVLVVISALTYRFIEAPAMTHVWRTANIVRLLLGRSAVDRVVA